MQHPSAPRTEYRWLIGLLGILIIPLAIVGDTLIAMSQGWPLAEGGSFGRFVWPLAVVCILAMLLCLLPWGRQLFARRAGQFWVLSVALLLSLAVGEALLSRLHPQAQFHRRPAEIQYRYDPDSSVVPGVFGAATATINRLGLRGPDLPTDAEVYRILCVGGSTTECLFLDDTETWPALLMSRLNQESKQKYWVGVAAVSEMDSADHLRFLRESPIVGDVQCVVLMAGANDFMRLVLGMGAGGHKPPAWLESNWLAHLREIWNVKLRAGFVVDRTGQRYAALERSLPIAAGTLRIKDALDSYESRLRSIVETAKERQVRLVFCTQPVMWDEFLTTLGRERLRLTRAYPEAPDHSFLAGDCRAIFDQFNLRLSRVAAERGVEIIDAAAKMNGVEVYFYDDFHLNERGCIEFAQLLASWFLEHPTKAAEENNLRAGVRRTWAPTQ
ncbi:MAG: SGNH/GDSL hydrolase family protein [Pirellulales bacterium]